VSNKPFKIQPAAEFRPNEQGAWAGIPNAEYHKLPGESNSLLTVLEECPLLYRRLVDGVVKIEPTHDMEIGTILHELVGEGTMPSYYLRPATYGPEGKKWNGNATECKAWEKAHADKPVLVEEEVAMIKAVVAEVRAEARLMKLVRGAQTEVTACAYNENLDHPYLLRCRFDLVGRDEQGWFFLDWKSTRNAATDAFGREIMKRRYHAQMAHYRRVLRRLTGEEVRCYLVALEKSASLPRVNVRQLAKAAMDEGDKIVDERLALFKRCKISNRWPALPDDEGAENICFIDLPDYAYEDVDISGS
jgi:hypothetical protein